MLVTIAKYITLLFGMFLITIGILMLLKPELTRGWLKKAGSTNLINYAEITLRMIPAAAMIIYSSASKFPDIFYYVGWFMIGTSLILFLVPRKIHHNFALQSAAILSHSLIRILSPIAILMGIFLIYSVL